jgi:hypothetical protein
MSIDSDVFSSAPVKSLCDMFMAEGTPRSFFGKRVRVPEILNALGACAGFAAQVAVWRELILPAKRNPGDFLVFATTKSGEIFFLGEPINQFLFATTPERLSFLSLAGVALSNASELPDIADLVRHVAGSLGSKDFGRPRVPPSVSLSELPRAALGRTWGKAAHILRENRPAEWPALLGAAAYNITDANRQALAPPLALKILLEAAVPMSKLNPATVAQAGVPTPVLTDWSMRALQGENAQEIIREVQGVMPPQPSRIAANAMVIAEPAIAFLNLGGASCEAIAAQDKQDAGGLFRGKVRNATAPTPSCDVLFLYCTFEPSGSIAGQSLSLRELIRDSGAKIAVIASEIRPEMLSNRDFQKSIQGGSNPPVNLVIVGNRNGEAFGRFFMSLFQSMWNGVPMPLAWVELAPQGPMQREDIPGTICIMEAGHVVFGKG